MSTLFNCNCDTDAGAVDVKKDIQCRTWAPSSNCACGGAKGILVGFNDWGQITMTPFLSSTFSPCGGGGGGGGGVPEDATCYKN